MGILGHIKDAASAEKRRSSLFYILLITILVLATIATIRLSSTFRKGIELDIRDEGKGLKNFMVKLLVVVMGILWARMLRIDMGEAVVLLVWPMYALRNKESVRNVLAAIMAMACSFFSVFFVMAPFGCLFLHFYNGEKGEEEPPKVLTYAAYPAAMILLALAGMFLV